MSDTSLALELRQLRDKLRRLMPMNNNPERFHVEKDGLIQLRGHGKGGLAPLLPVHRLMHGGAEVGRRRLVEIITDLDRGTGGLSHSFSLEHFRLGRRTVA